MWGCHLTDTRGMDTPPLSPPQKKMTLLASANALVSQINTAAGFPLVELFGGLSLIFWVVLPALKFVYGFLSSALCGRSYLRKGEWAVVTGSTDGIGKAYAQALVKRGMNVLLVARSVEKLAEVKAELGKDAREGVEVDTHVADFSGTDIYPGIAKALKGKDVSVLINNVGVSYPYAMFFHELAATSTKKTPVLQDMVNINVTSMVEMTALVLPGMLERKRGAVINISSAAGVAPTGAPLLALYSSTKAAVNYFSESLTSELAGKGVRVESHIPYFVTTKLSKIRHSSLFTPTPKAWVAASLAALGSGAPTKVPFWSHALQHHLLHAIPLALSDAIQKAMHFDIRKKGQRKAEKAAKGE